MTDSIAQNIESVLPFLPGEPGLRSHVVRVATLTGRAVKENGGTPGQIETAEIAALLHHYKEDAEAAGDARLLSDLGFTVAPAAPLLPVSVSSVLRSMAEKNANDQEIFAFLDSANFLDEQFENLPYEDLSTAAAIRELTESGLLHPGFVSALNAFRVVSARELSEPLRVIRLDVAAGRWFPVDGGEELLLHSAEVARAASSIALESHRVSEADAILAASFHDIGRLPFQRPGIAVQLGDWENLGFPATYAEFLISGTDHAEIGADYLMRAGFAEPIVEAIRYHQRPELTPSPLAAVLYAAEDPNESLPSCARDYMAAKRLEITERRRTAAN